MHKLKSGQLVEVDKGKLIAEYVGQTAKKTTEVFKSALRYCAIASAASFPRPLQQVRPGVLMPMKLKNPSSSRVTVKFDILRSSKMYSPCSSLRTKKGFGRKVEKERMI